MLDARATNLTRSTIITLQMYQITGEWGRLQLDLQSRIFVTRAASFNIPNCVLQHSLFTLHMAFRVKGDDCFSTQCIQTDLCDGNVACCETALKVHTQFRLSFRLPSIIMECELPRTEKPCTVRKKYSFQSNNRKLVHRIFLRIREVPGSNLGSENCYPGTKCALPHQGNACPWTWATTGF